MNVERLRMLQDLISRVSDGKWYGGEPVAYHNFLWFKWPKKAEIKYDLRFWLSKRRGGYSACAIGHAMLDKNFNEPGFSYSGSIASPHFEGKDGFEAVCAFFDIQYKTAELLFKPMSYSDDCLQDPIWFLLRLDWLLHNAHCDEDKFKADYETYNREI